MQSHCILGLIKQMDLLKFMKKIRYLVLFDLWKDIISGKSDIRDSINHNFGEIRIESYDSSVIENILIFHNVVILIKSVVKKNKNEYYNNIFLEKGLYTD